MCLAVPAKIVSLDGPRAVVEVPGNRFSADVSLTPGVAVGDYVLVHAGFAIERYTEKDALEVLKLLSSVFVGGDLCVPPTSPSKEDE